MWSDLFTLADAQYGAIGRWQATANGMPASTFDARAEREGWRRQFPGVVLVPGARWDELTRTSAALLATAGRGLLARESSLWLGGVTSRPPTYVQLIVPWGTRSPRLPGVVCTRTRTLEPADAVTVRGLAATSLPRTFLDLSGPRPDRRVRAWLIDGQQKALVDLVDVARRVVRARGSTGRPQLLLTIRDLEPGRADSILTDEVHSRLLSSGLRPDRVPAEVPVAGRILHPDVTFSPELVAIECDGLAYHSAREQLDIDHRKSNAYQVAGWVVLRITWDRLDLDWSGFVGELGMLLERRAPRSGALRTASP